MTPFLPNPEGSYQAAAHMHAEKTKGLESVLDDNPLLVDGAEGRIRLLGITI